MSDENKMYAGGYFDERWKHDFDGMAAHFRDLLLLAGCDPVTIKHSYSRTERYLNPHGPYHAWEGTLRYRS